MSPNVSPDCPQDPPAQPGGLQGALDFEERPTIDHTPNADKTPAQVVCELQELIVALDRRVPQVERLGEVAIATAAAVLRNEAVKRIGALERAAAADRNQVR